MNTKLLAINLMLFILRRYRYHDISALANQLNINWRLKDPWGSTLKLQSSLNWKQPLINLT